MRKPTEAIERMRKAAKTEWLITFDGIEDILAYLDSIPEGAVPVVWSSYWPKKAIEQAANEPDSDAQPHEALRCRARLPRRLSEGESMTTPTPRTELDFAILFHETYERLASSFDYETRPDTRAFDPESKNGRLMVAVMREVAMPLQRELAAAQEALKAAEARAEQNAKDAERMTFLHERCSVTFTFKRDDGTCAMIAGPTNLRAAIDAAMKEPK